MLSTNRKKALQTATLKTVRAMRSVLYTAYQVHSLFIVTSLPTKALQRRFKRRCSRETDYRRPWDLTKYYESENCLYAHRGQVDLASGSRPGAKLLTTPPSAGYFPPRLREVLAAERNDTGLR